jgi:hypothetical protein
MQYARRTDANQKPIVEALRKAGFSVIVVSDVGNGLSDLIVGFWMQGVGPYAILMEVKDGTKAPAQRQLTKAQLKMVRGWRGPYAVVESKAEALWLATQLRQGNVLALEAEPFLSRLPPDRRGRFAKPPGIVMPGHTLPLDARALGT